MTTFSGFILPENDTPEAVKHFSTLKINSSIPFILQDDPQVLSWRWSSNLITKIKNNISNPSRLPNSNEIKILEELQNDIKSQFTSSDNDDPNHSTTNTSILSEDEKLLERLWDGFYGHEKYTTNNNNVQYIPYSRYSKNGKELVFNMVLIQSQISVVVECYH
jgi:hypothetical protein